MLRHLQQADENFPCVPFSTFAKLENFASEKYPQWLPLSAKVLWQEQVIYQMRRKDRSTNCNDNFMNLKKQCDKYFDDLDDVEDTCKQAKENMKTARLVRHSQQGEGNFPCVPISTACKLKLPEMASVVRESG